MQLRLLLIGLIAGCAAPAPRPEIVLVVDSTFAAGDLDHVIITVDSPMLEPQTIDASLAEHSFPLSLDLLAFDPTALPSLEVRVVAQHSGAEVVRREVRTRFVAARRILLRIMLVPECATAACAPGDTCDEGGCTAVQIDPTELADFTGDLAPSCPRTETERCNGRDDDCDGQVDETFDLSTDRENCGMCGRACAEACTMSACTGAHITGIAAGGAHACGFAAGAGAWCWGSDLAGQLGSGAQSRGKSSMTGYLSARAVPVMGLAVVDEISAGGLHTCALSRGQAWCWGSDADGQLGDAMTGDAYQPVLAMGISAADAIACGAGHSCVVGGGQVSCWGRNDHGQLGGSTSPSMVSLSASATEIATGLSHTCALAGTSVYCWGAGDRGQLGNGAMADSMAPVAVSGVNDAIAIAAGASHSCAVRMDGTAACWGGNDNRELGDGTTQASMVPVAVAGVSGAQHIAASLGGHTCAWGSGGAFCWGSNQGGQLGMAATEMPATAVALPVSDVSTIAVGGAGPPPFGFTCALTAAGTVQCWGRNELGQLGRGDLESSPSPAAVQGLP